MCFIPTEIRTVCHLKYSGPTPPEMLQKSPNADSTMFCKFAVRELQPLAEINGSLLPLPLDERRQISSSVLGDSGKHHLEKYRAWQTHLRVAPQAGGAEGAPGLPGNRILIPCLSRKHRHVLHWILPLPLPFAPTGAIWLISHQICLCTISHQSFFV